MTAVWSALRKAGLPPFGALLLTMAPIGYASAQGASASGSPAASDVQTLAAYAAWEPLIGDWDTGPSGAPTVFVQHFSWGPNRGYVWFRVGLLLPSGDEHLHFEGPILWNATTRKFDYLFTVEPGSLAQEKGEITVQDDGDMVREVTLTNADGSIAHFRQTFRQSAPDRFETSLLRQSAAGWAPNFPGSDHLIMTRRSGSG